MYGLTLLVITGSGMVYGFRKQPALDDIIGYAAEAAALQAQSDAEQLLATMRRRGEALRDPSFKGEVTYGSKRLRGTVWTANYAAKYAQHRWRVLESSMTAIPTYYP